MALISSDPHRQAPLGVPATYSHALHHVPEALLAPLRPSWDRLPPDPYPNPQAGASTSQRLRRLTRFAVHADRIEARPNRPVIQLPEHNCVWGGVPRTFASMEPEVVASPAFQSLCALFLERLPMPRAGLWLRAHQIRVRCEAGDVARPDTQGAHREGVLLLSVLVVDVHGLVPGPTRLIRDGEATPCFERALGVGDHLYVDDARLLHATAPSRRITATPAWRDVLLLAVTQDEVTGTVL